VTRCTSTSAVNGCPPRLNRSDPRSPTCTGRLDCRSTPETLISSTRTDNVACTPANSPLTCRRGYCLRSIIVSTDRPACKAGDHFDRHPAALRLGDACSGRAGALNSGSITWFGSERAPRGRRSDGPNCNRTAKPGWNFVCRIKSFSMPFCDVGSRVPSCHFVAEVFLLTVNCPDVVDFLYVVRTSRSNGVPHVPKTP
jgi:hypothetical protein